MKLTRLILIPLILCSFFFTSCEPLKEKYNLKVFDEADLIREGPYLSTARNKRARRLFHEGDLVVFKTAYVYDADVVARLNGEVLQCYDYEDDLSFRFYMPAQNSELSISIEGGI